MEDQVQSSLIVKTFPVGPLQCNCTLIGNPQSGQAILIDPGGDSEMLLQELSEHQLQLVEILHTHAHLDHFLASGKIKEATGAFTASRGFVSLGHAGRSMQDVWFSL